MNSADVKSSLRSRVFKAGAWVISGHFLGQVLRLGSNLIMTRLLVPEMFGIMAVANVLIFGLALLSDLGLKQNIIQSARGGEPRFLNTVWIVQIFRGGIISLLGFSVALGIYLINSAGWWPPESVYAEPILPYVIAALAFTGLISGLESTKLATANRELSMGLVTRLDVITQAAGMAFMIVWALIDRSIWALVAGALFGKVLMTIFSHVLLPGERNRWQWDGEAFHEIFHFGKWVFISSLLVFNVMNGDRLILGGLIDSVTLGYYAIAFFLMNALQMVVSAVAGNVVYPALSEVVRDRPDDLKRTYYRFRMPVDVITLFASGALFMSGHLIIDLLYDDRYLAAGHMLEVLSIALFFERYTLSGQCFIALGKPKLLVPLITMHLLAVYGVMPLAFFAYGLDGALWALAGGRLLTLPLLFKYKLRHGLVSWSAEWRFLPLFGLGLLVGWGANELAAYIGLSG